MSTPQTLLGAIFGFMLSVSLTFGQVLPASETALPAILAPTTPIEAADLSVPEPTALNTFIRRIQRFFTFSAIKRQKVSLDIANMTLLRARQAATAGDSVAAERLVESYNQQINQISTATNELSTQLPVTENQRVASLIDQITISQVQQVSLLDGLRGARATGQFNKKLEKARLEALKDLARLLEHENLSPEKFQEKLEKISRKLTEKETKAARKLEKKLAFLEELDEVADDEALEEAIVAEEEAEIEAIEVDEPDEIDEPDEEAIDVEEFEELADRLGRALPRSIAVLERVLERAPEAARAGIETAIQASVVRVQTLVSSGALDVDDLSSELAKHGKLAERAFARISQGAQPSDSSGPGPSLLKLAEKIEKAEKKIIKESAKAEEKARKRAEKREEKERKRLEEEAGTREQAREAEQGELKQAEEEKQEEKEGKQEEKKTDEKKDGTTGTTGTTSSTSGGTSGGTSPSTGSGSTTGGGDEETKLSVTITDTSCGGEVSVTKDKKYRLLIKNTGVAEYKYRLASLDVEKGVKAGETEETSFTAKSTGTYRGTCERKD